MLKPSAVISAFTGFDGLSRTALRSAVASELDSARTRPDRDTTLFGVMLMPQWGQPTLMNDAHRLTVRVSVASKKTKMTAMGPVKTTSGPTNHAGILIQKPPSVGV